MPAPATPLRPPRPLPARRLRSPVGAVAAWLCLRTQRPGARVLCFSGSAPVPPRGHALELSARAAAHRESVPIPDPLAGHLRLSRFSVCVSVTLAASVFPWVSLLARCLSLCL